MADFSVLNISSLDIDSPQSYKDLLSRAKAGEQAAFGELYNLSFEKIYRFIYVRVNHKELAEDLTEEVFLKAYQKIGSLNQDRSFSGWLFMVARNTVIDYYRSKRADLPLETIENSLEYVSQVLDEVRLDSEQKLFLSLLSRLPAEQQIVIKLRFFEQLETPEIAEMLHKSEGAVRVIQHRAIAKLKQLFKDHEEKF